MRLKAKARRAQLIETAMQLFSVQGFDGTTTQQIAKQAGVNEAIIFRHFRSKEQLYWAVVTSRVQAVGRRRKIREHIAAGRDERETLAAIAGSLLDRTHEDTALTRLLFFSALRNPKLADSFFRTYMRGTFEVLADYFRQGVDQGRFRCTDPVISARGFLGMIIYHYLVQEVFGGERYQRFDPYVVGNQIADLCMHGISVAAGPRAPTCANGNGNGHKTKKSTKPRRKESNNKAGTVNPHILAGYRTTDHKNGSL
jgi:TetR/AcrR family transcriptional regulator